MTRPFASHLSDDRIVDLVADLLEPSARQPALDHLRVCPACERRFQETCGHRERLELRSMDRPAATSAAATIGRRWWLAGGAAAALAIVGVLAISLLSWRARADGLDYWLPLEGERLMLRSTPGPEEDGRYLAAVDAYARRDVRQVIALLQGRPIPQAYEPLQLLLASALIQDRRNLEAIELLDRLDVFTLPQPARDRALWLLYVALRRDGRDDAAREVARGLSASTGEFADRARAELSRP